MILMNMIVAVLKMMIIFCTTLWYNVKMRKSLWDSQKSWPWFLAFESEYQVQNLHLVVVYLHIRVFLNIHTSVPTILHVYNNDSVIALFKWTIKTTTTGNNPVFNLHFLKFLFKSNLTPILVVSIWHIFYVGSVIYWVVKFANYVLVEIKFDSYIGSINITHILCWIRDLLSCQRYWEKWPGSRASCNTCAPPSWWWWWWW